ncbi:MAG: YdcF family protein [Firmicutes bacterium]|nr:YdcF family protein [Bacillota bacterium]
MVKNKKWLRRVVRVLLCLVLIGAALLLSINVYVKGSAAGRIISAEEAAALGDVDCVLVLGCLVHNDGRPSEMLQDRLERGIELYGLDTAPKLLLSGDHGQRDYNEVGVMKQYALAAGIASEDVFMDHAGFSTYESMYRAREIFGVEKAVIVTQEYHLYRALYIAGRLGIDAYGVASDQHVYRGQFIREAREILARCKDFVTSLYQPLPQYLGEAIPISGSGDLTNDY